MTGENINPRREYLGKPNSSFVHFPTALRKGFLSPQKNPGVIESPISAHRILIKILNDISNDQWREENIHQQSQISLFDSEMKTKNNSFAKFSFPVTQISEKRDYANIEKGLVFLENFLKDWYKSVNSKGKAVKTYGGIISQPNISEGKVSFLMSTYWLEQFLTLGIYKPIAFSLPWTLSNTKSVLFYYWLLTLKEEGTLVDWKRFQATYKYNYIDANTYAKSVLKPLRKKLDQGGDYSFFYSVKGKNIFFKRYSTKDKLQLAKGSVSRSLEITQKIHYWKKRHKLDANYIAVFRAHFKADSGHFMLLCSSYKDLLASLRKKNEKATDYLGEEFIKIFQEQIIITYKTKWGSLFKNGYPEL